MALKYAYTSVEDNRGGWGIGRATEGVPGYVHVLHYGPFPTLERADGYAEHLNKMLNLTPDAAFKIVASTMRTRGKGGG